MARGKRDEKKGRKAGIVERTRCEMRDARGLGVRACNSQDGQLYCFVVFCYVLFYIKQ